MRDDLIWKICSVVGMFIIQAQFGMSIRAFGILFIAFKEKFNTSATISASIGAVNLAFFGIAGPLGSYMCVKFGCRWVAIVGSLLQSTGYLLVAFASHIWMIYIGFGVLIGVGVSISSTAAYIIVPMYFTRQRALALSIGSSGSGLAVFGFPPFIQFLLDVYGFQNTGMLLSAVCLHGVIGGALFRTPDIPPKTESPLETKASPSQDAVHNQESGDKAGQNDVELKLLSKTIDGGSSESSDSSPTLIIHDQESGGLQQESKPPPVEQQHPYTQETVHARKQQGEQIRVDEKPCGEVVEDTTVIGMVQAGFNLIHQAPPIIGLMAVNYGLTVTDSAFLTFIAALGKDNGLSDFQFPLLISAVGFADLFGRNAIGLILGLQSVLGYRVIIYSGIGLVCGALTIITPLFSTFVALMLMCVFYGCFIGSIFAQRPTVSADLVGVKDMPLIFGVLVFCNALGHVTGRFMGGLIKDSTKRYGLVFIICGSVGVICSICLLLLSIQYLRASKKNGKVVVSSVTI